MHAAEAGEEEAVLRLREWNARSGENAALPVAPSNR